MWSFWAPLRRQDTGFSYLTVMIALTFMGIAMSAVGFLKFNPNPTRQELAHGVSGNLCRCQDYDKILTALMKGAEYMRGASNA